MWQLLRDSTSSWLRIRLIFFWAVSRKDPVHPSTDLTLYWINWLCPECSWLIEGLCLTIWTAQRYQRGLGHTSDLQEDALHACQVGNLGTFYFIRFSSAIAVLSDWAGISLFPYWTSYERSNKTPGTPFHTKKHDLVSNERLTLICELSDALFWWGLLVHSVSKQSLGRCSWQPWQSLQAVMWSDKDLLHDPMD